MKNATLLVHEISRFYHHPQPLFRLPSPLTYELTTLSILHNSSQQINNYENRIHTSHPHCLFNVFLTINGTCQTMNLELFISLSLCTINEHITQFPNFYFGPSPLGLASWAIKVKKDIKLQITLHNQGKKPQMPISSH